MSDDIEAENTKPFSELVFPVFCFGERSEPLQEVKSLLMKGISLEIFAIDLEYDAFLVRTFSFAHWTHEELLQRAQDESGLGMWKMAHQPVMALGVDSPATRVMNETLDAGFSVHLIGEPASPLGVMGNYTLLANISDNA